MKFVLAKYALIAFALATILPACGQPESAITRVNFCLEKAKVNQDGSITTYCDTEPIKFNIPSRLISGMDTSRPYVSNLHLLMKMTQTEITGWPRQKNSDESLTTELFNLTATSIENTFHHHMSGDLLLWSSATKYQESSPVMFNGFLRFDISQCADQLHIEQNVTGQKSNCNITSQYFKPVDRQDVFFECLRPFVNTYGNHYDRWCTSVVEIVPSLVLNYTLKRSALESGEWVDIDRRVRAFFTAMQVKE